jgi:hypothetical protein
MESAVELLVIRLETSLVIAMVWSWAAELVHHSVQAMDRMMSLVCSGIVSELYSEVKKVRSWAVELVLHSVVAMGVHFPLRGSAEVSVSLNV